MYTGALENHPNLVKTISRRRMLYGNSAEVLARARDPFQWTTALMEAGLPALAVQRTAAGLDASERWLRKPFRSAGGRGIAFWRPNGAGNPSSQHYYQRYRDGEPVSAVFVGNGSDAVLLGVTRQILGLNWRDRADAMAPSPEWTYAGSIGPLPLTDAAFAQCQVVGRTLAAACGLMGLFGVDAILAEGQVWPVEINPRYTASIEVLERASALRTGDRRATRLQTIAWHVAACRDGVLPSPVGQSGEWTAAKAIVYAPRRLVFGSRMARSVVEQNLGSARPVVADIPAVGEPIEPGGPVCTLLAEGKSGPELWASLRTRGKELLALAE